MTFGRAGYVVLLAGAVALGACREQGGAASSGGAASTTATTTTSDARSNAGNSGTSGAGASTDAGGAARGGTAGASADAGATTASAAGSAGASGVFEGSATGASADPPIREFAPRVVVPAWSEHGTVHLEVPEGDGAVSGTMVLGDLRFNARGRRVGPRVRASLEQPPPAGAGDGGTGVPLYYGTLDGDVTGAGLRGTWEASAQGGYLRRRGTFEAQRH